ncbi:MAG: hypothetical protein ABI903_17985 [Actinomycetota bacterium]
MRLRSAACGDGDEKAARVIHVAFVMLMLSIRANLLICVLGPGTTTWNGGPGRRSRLGHARGAGNVINSARPVTVVT